MKTEMTIFVIFMTDPTTQRRARKSGTTGRTRPPWIFSKYYRMNVYLMFEAVINGKPCTRGEVRKNKIGICLLARIRKLKKNLRLL